METQTKPAKAINLPVCKILYTENHNFLRMTVQTVDKSKLVATISWSSAKMRQEIMNGSVHAETLKIIAKKWNEILKLNSGTPLSQMKELQDSAFELLK